MGANVVPRADLDAGLGTEAKRWSELHSGEANVSAIYLPYVAAEGLGANRVVKINSDGEVEYADSDSAGDYGQVVGITKAAVLTGETAFVQIAGKMTELVWTWTPGALIFLGNNGLLTATAPTTGHVTTVGAAVKATEIIIMVRSVCVLA